MRLLSPTLVSVSRIAIALSFWGAIRLPAEPPPLPFSVFFEPAALSLPKLSPDGTHLLLFTRDKDQGILRSVDTRTFQAEILASFDSARLGNAWWKGNDRLLLLTDYGNGSYRFSSLRLSDKKVDDLNFLRTWRTEMLDELPNDPDTVLLSTAGGDLCRLNLQTDEIKRIAKNPGYYRRWLIGPNGEAIGAVGTRDKRRLLYWRNPNGEKWSQLDLGPENESDLTILAVHSDGWRFIALDRGAGDLATIIAFDPATGQKETVFSDPEFEPSSILRWSGDSGGARAIVHQTDRIRYHLLDGAAAALQAAIDAALPATTNGVYSISRDRQKVVVLATSDSEAGAYFLLDRTAKKLVPLGKASAIPPGVALGSGRPFTFAARDGMRIHGRLTLPAAANIPPPLIVLLDEYFASSRTTSGFHAFRQLLATRGYAVAEIDTRGTYGFGRAYVKAGDYQIADGVPHDVEDGVRFLINEGRIDARRIGVIGLGYGGVTAMHLLAQAPDLFTCWVNWNTPLTGDSALHFQDLAARNRTWKEAAEDLGGRKAALQFSAAVNPSTVAAKIKTPSLHYYDHQPIQRQAMKDLLKKHRLPHVFVEELSSAKECENHGEFLDACERTFAFLRERLAPAAIVAGPVAAPP